MTDDANGFPAVRVLPSLSPELGRRTKASRVALGLNLFTLTTDLNADGIPITVSELVLMEAGEPIEWAEPGFALIAALAFLFEVSASEALREPRNFAVSLAKSANRQRAAMVSTSLMDAGLSEEVLQSAGLPVSMLTRRFEMPLDVSEAMIESLNLPMTSGDLERMEAGEAVEWADPGLRLAAALATRLNIYLDNVVMTTLSQHFGKSA